MSALSRRAVVAVFVVLVILTAAEIGVVNMPGIARSQLVGALVAMALAKAGLVLLFFMHLRRPDPLLRLAAGTALVFLAFMFALTFSDVLTRRAPTQPGTVTPRAYAPEQAMGHRAF